MAVIPLEEVRKILLEHRDKKVEIALTDDRKWTGTIVDVGDIYVFCEMPISDRLTQFPLTEVAGISWEETHRTGIEFRSMD